MRARITTINNRFKCADKYLRILPTITEWGADDAHKLNRNEKLLAHLNALFTIKDRSATRLKKKLYFKRQNVCNDLYKFFSSVLYWYILGICRYNHIWRQINLYVCVCCSTFRIYRSNCHLWFIYRQNVYKHAYFICNVLLLAYNSFNSV